ncbi:TPA: type IV secretion protein Dot [Legionella pneumophila]|nr:type IV secretion protein Dot [Legionella pneumophila]HAU1604977.1 type IV secretion protein Dot [Legionella pneumophila]HAU1847449.1 type IV secretion protein Dot [Legionella pneumophila]
MAAQLDPSSEFAALVKQLHKAPDDSGLKQAVVKRLPEMQVLAKTNPLALFRLAQIYSPSSSQYKQMILQSAAQGCTNAMLSACEILLKSGSTNDLITAAHYMRLIQRSKDSYIIELGKKLLEKYPGFAEELKSNSKEVPYHSAIRFFGIQTENSKEEEAKIISRPTV